MPRFLKIFVHSKEADVASKAECAYKQQLEYCKKAWHSHSYGLERLVRLFLCSAQFAFPLLLVRDLFGRKGATSRKLAVEAYNVAKFIFPLAVLATGLYRRPAVTGIIIYLLSETVLHILSLIFLEDIHGALPSYRRSILLLFLHYLEVVFDFAVIYITFGLVSEALTPVSAVYFSLVANTTVGFGDIHAQGSAGQAAVIAQLIVGVLFIILFINHFSEREK
ncbi:MAG: potassium channel family protein [Candidatus Omnitrophica bacterium]|nr:potassium channel family protein [Candidatus Omnitrophota bacterium]